MPQRTRTIFIVCALLVLEASTGSTAGSVPLRTNVDPQTRVQRFSGVSPERHRVGLGKVLTTADGGQVFGYDIDQNGNDGILATSKISQPGIYTVSVETFNQDTGVITSSFANYTGKRHGFVVDGIFAGDVALVTHTVEPKGSIFTVRYYNVVNPVTANTFTGNWVPPIKDVDIQLHAENQQTSTSVVYAIELKNQDLPVLIVSDIATNTITKVIRLEPSQFSLNIYPQLSQDIVHNKAVLATSPDAGAAGGPPPVIATVDLQSGAVTEFSGVDCPGIARCGTADGIGYDSNTGIACTTTALDGGVEFYDVTRRTGFHEFLPGGSSFGGAFVANDPPHRLFLVADIGARNGGSIQIYDEAGRLVESINGLTLYANSNIALNPSKRMGWVTGSNFSQLQQFFY